MTTNEFDEAMEEVSIVHGCDWNDESKVAIMARFMKEQGVDFGAWEKFLEQQAEEETLGGDEEDEEQDRVRQELREFGFASYGNGAISTAHHGGYTVTGHDFYHTVEEAMKAIDADETASPDIPDIFRCGKCQEVRPPEQRCKSCAYCTSLCCGCHGDPEG
jgi:hypothetical protein